MPTEIHLIHKKIQTSLETDGYSMNPTISPHPAGVQLPSPAIPRDSFPRLPTLGKWNGHVLLSILFWCATADALAIQFSGIRMDEQQLVSLVFGNHGSLPDARQAAEVLLESQLEQVKADFPLNARQQEILLLAGEGDIQRFLRKCQQVFREHFKPVMTQEEWLKGWKHLQPLRAEFAQGLHKEGSLFAKTLQTIRVK
ncbi:MAG: hypothetical protein R3C12_04590 [Planctomycetaceae bacterium]|nr:hypothetical protein [Planctomycetaceae bacterium]